jgi:phage shock protein C
MTTQKKLQRSDDDRWIGGVCGGIAEYTGIDAGLIRLVVVVATLLGAGSLILAYIVAWVIMPKAHPLPYPPSSTSSQPTPPAPEQPSE